MSNSGLVPILISVAPFLRECMSRTVPLKGASESMNRSIDRSKEKNFIKKTTTTHSYLAHGSRPPESSRGVPPSGSNRDSSRQNVGDPPSRVRAPAGGNQSSEPPVVD